MMKSILEQSHSSGERPDLTWPCDSSVPTRRTWAEADLPPTSWTLDYATAVLASNSNGEGIVAERGVTAQPIVEYFDALENVLCRLFARVVLAMVDEFALERPGEALDTGIIPTVACAAHVGGDTVFTQQTLVVARGVLTVPIRVVRESGLGIAVPERHCERLLREFTREPRPHRPADHGAQGLLNPNSRDPPSAWNTFPLATRWGERKRCQSIFKMHVEGVN